MTKIGYFLKFNIFTYVVLTTFLVYIGIGFVYDNTSMITIDGKPASGFISLMSGLILIIMFWLLSSKFVYSYRKMTIIKIHKLIPYLLKKFNTKKFIDDHMIEHYITKMDDGDVRDLIYQIATSSDVNYTGKLKHDSHSFGDDYKYKMYMNWSTTRFNIETFKILRYIKKKKLEIDFKEL